MSFFSDLFEGNFGNLGKDIVDAPSSLVSHPDELAETLGVGALFAAPFVVPELIGGLGALGGTEAALGTEAAIEGGDLAAGLGIGDIAGAADAATAATLAGEAAPAIGDALAFLPGFAEEAAPLAFSGAETLGLGTDTALESLAPFSSAADSFLPDTSALAELGSDAGGFNIPGTGASNLSLMPDVISDVGGVTPATIGEGGTSFADNAFGASAGAAGKGTLATDLGIGDIGGGGGITGTLNSVLSSPWARLGLGAAPLALALFRGEPGVPPQAQQSQANAAALSQFGQQQLAMGQAGQLNAGQMALIAQTKQDLTNQYRQALYNQGVQNPQADTRWAQMEAQIDQQVTAMTATMIQQEIDNGLKALGASSATLNQIAQMQMTADQNFTNTLVNATKALGLAAGSGLIRTTTTTTQAAA